jgi:hypothetical protein
MSAGGHDTGLVAKCAKRRLTPVITEPIGTAASSLALMPYW